MYGPRHIFRSHWRLILFILVVVLIFWVFYLLRSVLFPFLFGLLLAYMLLPLVAWLEARLPLRDRWPGISRILAIVIIFILIIALLGFFFFYIFTTIFNAASNLIANAGDIINSALQIIQEWTGALLLRIPPALQTQVSQYLQDAVTGIVNAMRGVIIQGLAFIPTSVGLVFGLASLPLFLFYLLNEWESMRDNFYSAFSPQLSEHIRNVIMIVGDVMAQYFRGQLILAVIVGSMDFVGLTILGIGFSPALGFLGALGEFVPVIGPWLNGIIGALVTLSIAPGKVVWVIIFYAAVQLLENILFVPKIQGNFMRIHPAVVLVLLVVGSHLAGFWGIILVLPVAASIVRIYDYIRHVTAIEDAREIMKRK